MPMYQYQCDNEHLLDQLEKMGPDTHPDCPAEGCGLQMRRVFGKVSFSFKNGAPTPNFGQRAAAIRRKFG